MHTKTVTLPGNFSFDLINFVNLSTTFFIQRFFRFFYFFKNPLFNVFLFWGGQRVLHLYCYWCFTIIMNILLML